MSNLPSQEGLEWRKVLAADLGLYNAALFFFALLPTNEIIVPEVVTMVLAAIGLSGVSSHASRRFSLPYDEWAYLLTGWIGIYVLLAYSSLTPAPPYIKIPFVCFLLAGVASAYAAHVIDGGKAHSD